ncbi:hypothetical protein Kpol_1020p18 [Vanderwaltozyma polyspora DSM 70294]|uniref:Rab-GAP TBC domain-containing protein n=1 Tax=Vanderwaltozyma polyspora (strain ATCC 22028 / DSM 70294 / BCRC 21397 / CBS 2163 / NBRC 10782 / NRRL Y-8283 / UCD 57-17) TaxID=436907 RepID=A7TLC9_VANPO|nr:uncharacterized protein Kpol_1020p18 [Vanderwaltozyma polyspora DSM 70294]EDO16910.1 hypothetical protein Kpol_1020p18 [Vanderwaltozyma polyspora DSM 70294]
MITAIFGGFNANTRNDKEVPTNVDMLEFDDTDITSQEDTTADSEVQIGDLDVSLNHSKVDDEPFLNLDDQGSNNNNNETYSILNMCEMSIDDLNEIDVINGRKIEEPFNLLDASKLESNIMPASSDHYAHSYDRYGFRKASKYITEEEYDKWWSNYSYSCSKNKNKWERFMSNNGLPVINDTPKKFPAKNDKLKKLVRKGVPAEWRGDAWWAFVNGDDLLNKNKNLYMKLLRVVSQLDEFKNRNDKNADHKYLPELDVIERDLNRTFPNNLHFQREPFQISDPPMIKSLRNVLVAFAIYCPSIGYCQSLNFIAGLLLLFLDEERTFWMLVIITSTFLPGVHNFDLEGVNVNQGVLMLCVKEFLPEIWPFIEKNYNHDKKKPLHLRRTNEFLHKLPSIVLCTTNWLMSCFVGTFPIETTLRVWDCLFYEGSNFLFKISMSILKLNECHFMKNNDNGRTIYHFSIRKSNVNEVNRSNGTMPIEEMEAEILQSLQTSPKKYLDPDVLFDKTIMKRRMAFNKLDQDTIDTLRKYVTSQRLKYKKYSKLFGLNYDTKQNSSSKNDIYSDPSVLPKETINEMALEEIDEFKTKLDGDFPDKDVKIGLNNKQRMHSLP